MNIGKNHFTALGILFFVSMLVYLIQNTAQEPSGNLLEGPIVEKIYPTTSKIPENIIRFYIYFSEPIKEGSTIESVHIFHENGTELRVYDEDFPTAGIFLETLEELWSPDYQRITLILDPGRVKTGLQSNNEFGRVFEVGKKYSMKIDTKIANLKGQKLEASFTKEFEVISEDIIPPNIDNWNLIIPQENTHDPLTIELDDVLDHALAASFIRVQDSLASLQGEVKLKSNESIWQFYPDAKWQKGHYQITVNVELEDLAGNNLQGKFDRDNQVDQLLYLDQDEVILEFDIF